MGLGAQRHAPAALPPGKTRYPLHRKKAGWASGPVWRLPTGIRSTDRPARRCTDWAIPAHEILDGVQLQLLIATNVSRNMR
jgi:hypothetical protein